MEVSVSSRVEEIALVEEDLNLKLTRAHGHALLKLIYLRNACLIAKLLAFDLGISQSEKWRSCAFFHLKRFS